MLRAFLGLGALATGVMGLILFSKDNFKERLSKISGGERTVNAVELVSANYKGKIKVSGTGIPVSASGDSWDSCEWELKLLAAEANCNIVLEVTKSGSRKDGFYFSGIAYRKR